MKIPGYIVPGDTVFTGRQADHRVLVIQREPTRRTICADLQSFFIELPSMLFIIDFRGLAIWPLSAVSFSRVRVFVANATLRTFEDRVASCPLPMHQADGAICMGNAVGGFHRSLEALASQVVAGYFGSRWNGTYLSRGVASRDKSRFMYTLQDWADLTRTEPGLARTMDWVPAHEGQSFRQALGGNVWLGRLRARQRRTGVRP